MSKGVNYLFRCVKCGHRWEERRPMGTTKVLCPKCKEAFGVVVIQPVHRVWKGRKP
jgi:putative FmdB family regulatory protein